MDQFQSCCDFYCQYRGNIEKEASSHRGVSIDATIQATLRFCQRSSLWRLTVLNGLPFLHLLLIVQQLNDLRVWKKYTSKILWRVSEMRANCNEAELNYVWSDNTWNSYKSVRGGTCVVLSFLVGLDKRREHWCIPREFWMKGRFKYVLKVDLTKIKTLKKSLKDLPLNPAKIKVGRCKIKYFRE